jgi:hypothetical protein
MRMADAAAHARMQESWRERPDRAHQKAGLVDEDGRTQRSHSEDMLEVCVTEADAAMDHVGALQPRVQGGVDEVAFPNPRAYRPSTPGSARSSGRGGDREAFLEKRLVRPDPDETSQTTLAAPPGLSGEAGTRVSC